MPRAYTLTPETIAAYRPGAVVAVEMGAATGILAERPAARTVRTLASGGYQDVSASAAPTAPAASLTGIVCVRGVIEQRAADRMCGQSCGYDTIAEDIRAASEAASIGQIVIDMDSPGGDVAGLEEGARRMRACIVASGKPCLGYVNERACSAAVWLLSALCDGIYLPQSGEMGSLGSVVIFGSDARRISDEGTDIYVARDPGGKFKPNAVEPLDEIGKARLDRRALEGAARFFAFMATGGARGRAIPEDIARSWNGDTFSGAAAVAAGLADGVQSLEDTIALAAAWPRAEAKAA